MNILRNKRVVGAVLFTATSVMTAASAQTVTAVMHSGLRMMDPIQSTAFITREHGYMIYDTLVGIDSNFKVQPQMADWEVLDDGKVYRFTLRDGLQWHDGTPVTSEDCIASIKRWLDNDNTGPVLKDFLADTKIVDDQVFELHLTEATSLMLDSLAKISSRPAFMMPKRIVEDANEKAVSEMIGSGPFKFVQSEFRPGVKVVYEKNTDYVPRDEPADWTSGGKQVNVDRVEWVSMPDAMTSANALINEEVDFIEKFPFDLLPLVENMPGITAKVIDPLGNWSYYRFNHKHPPFDNKLVRQAAMYAVGQEDVMKALVGNADYYSTCASPFGCGTPNATDYGKEMIISANAKKAKELLAEANYDGTPVVLLHPTDHVMASPQPVVIASALKAAGFTVDMQSMDWQSVVTRRSNANEPAQGGWGIFATYGIVAASGDPFANTTIAANGKDAWFGWPDVPEIEALRLEYARATDDQSKQATAAKIQEFVVDEGVIVPLGQFRTPAAFRNTLQNIPEAPITVFWGLEKNS